MLIRIIITSSFSLSLVPCSSQVIRTIIITITIRIRWPSTLMQMIIILITIHIYPGIYTSCIYNRQYLATYRQYVATLRQYLAAYTTVDLHSTHANSLIHIPFSKLAHHLHYVYCRQTNVGRCRKRFIKHRVAKG